MSSTNTWYLLRDFCAALGLPHIFGVTQDELEEFINARAKKMPANQPPEESEID